MTESADPQLYIEVVDKPREPQSLEEIGLSDANLLDALSQFDLYGVWRLELETGLLYWSPDVFKIHEMSYAKGPVDVRRAIEAYHPDDRELVASCVDQAAKRKSGFRFVLRLLKPDGTYKLVKSNGRYRKRADGTEEVYGTFSEFQPRVRAIAFDK